MQTHNICDADELRLAEIGGKTLAGSGFENEQPEGAFTADVINVAAMLPRED